jgi:hypothetical protein
LGLRGTIPMIDGGGQTCLFSFDDRFAHGEGPDGGYVFGGDPADPCLCISAANASGGDRIVVGVEAPTRPKWPAPNAYTDQPYSVTLELKPKQLLPKCDAGCPPVSDLVECPP